MGKVETPFYNLGFSGVQRSLINYTIRRKQMFKKVSFNSSNVHGMSLLNNFVNRYKI